MLYTKSKNSHKIGKKTMQIWGKRGKFLPLLTFFKNDAPAGPQSSKPVKNTKNNPLAPQQPREGVELGVCAQK